MDIRELFAGIIVMGLSTAALFFFRFWQSAHDRLFALFGIAFLMLGLQQLLVALEPTDAESYPLYFLIRLAAFVLILIAIIDKNLRAKRIR